jgi:hypothetical protein
MRPDPRFTSKPPAFWAYVRSISQWLGYTKRGTGTISIPSSNEIRECLKALKLASIAPPSSPTPSQPRPPFGRSRPSAVTQSLCGGVLPAAPDCQEVSWALA